MMERTAAQTAALADELRNVIRQAQLLVVALAEDRDEALVEVRDRVSAALIVASERLSAVEDQAAQMKKTAGAALDNYVQENPWTSVAIAAAIGLIVGAWLVPSGGRPVDDGT